MREQFQEHQFSPESRRLIGIAQEICDRYAAQGYDLSLRQLYYQGVAANHWPSTERSYKNLGNLLNDARLAGLIDWAIIKDRTRAQVENAHWASPAEILRSAADCFQLDKWVDQPKWVIVLVEKQALEGVLIPVCRELDVPFLANRGYASASAFYELGERIARCRRSRNQACHVLYLGDHDPSGLDMGRDVQARLELFSRGPVYFERLALNLAQVEEFGPPPNPAKLTDSRAVGYVIAFGDESWELDALAPEVLARLVRGAILARRDDDHWRAALARERGMVRALDRMADQFEESREELRKEDEGE